jgi:hypothetical protein
MRRELISLDMPHFVSSDDSFDINQVTLDAYASDIEQARTALKLGTVVVMGHSIHGIWLLNMLVAIRSTSRTWSSSLRPLWARSTLANHHRLSGITMRPRNENKSSKPIGKRREARRRSRTISDEKRSPKGAQALADARQKEPIT